MKALWGYGGRCWGVYQCSICGERLRETGWLFASSLYLLHPKSNCQYSERKFAIPPPFVVELEEIVRKSRGEC